MREASALYVGRKYGIGIYGFFFTFYCHVPQGPDGILIVQEKVGGFTDNDRSLEIFRQSLEPGRKVYRISDGGILQPLPRTERSNDSFPSADPHTVAEF